MDPISTLAASAVAFLAPYLAEAGKEFAKEGGKAALGKIDILYKSLKARFQKKTSAREALADLEKEPDNKDVQGALRRQLTKELNADPKFVDALRKLLEEIKQDPPSHTFLTQVYGNVDQLINAQRIDSIVYNKRSRKN